jgi:hypothetical protein
VRPVIRLIIVMALAGTHQYGVYWRVTAFDR